MSMLHPFTGLDTTIVSGDTLICFFAQGKAVMRCDYPLFHLNENLIKLNFKLRYKTKDCKNAYFVFTSLDYQENVVSRDTLFLPLSDELTTYSKKLTVKSLYALVVSMEMESARSDKEGVISISDGGIFLNGERLPVKPSDYHPTPISRLGLVDWDRMLHLPFMDKKYLGLAETSHGTETYGQLAYEVMKERILHHRCKLVLLELSLNDMLYINRYVKNDRRFNIDSISNYLKQTVFAESTIDFLRWVKTYNASHHNEITVLGFDYPFEGDKSANQMSCYIRSLNKNNDAMVNDLCDSIAVKYKPEDIPSLLSLFDRTNLDGVVGSEEVGLIRSCISDLQDKYYSRYWSRDSRMPMLVEQIFSKYLASDATVTFLGHFDHLNYLSLGVDPVYYDEFSMGRSLRKKYGPGYSCIAISARGGENGFYENGFRGSGEKYEVWFSQPMKEAPEESIEYQVGKWGKTPVFMSVDKLKDTDVYKMRETGQGYSGLEQSFHYFLPKNRMDGIIVVDSAASGKIIEKNIEDMIRRHKQTRD